MKIGIVQMQMSWDLEHNLKTILEHIVTLDDLDVLLFPELALTGFHRKVASRLEPDAIMDSIKLLRELSKNYNKTLFLGAPITRSSGVYNSYLCINNRGDILAEWDKRGLTASEETFFSKGRGREIVQIEESTITTIICREAEDIDWFLAQMGAISPSLIIWPGYIGYKNEVGERKGYELSASKIASKLGAFVIQCNWPHALNDSAINGFGGSEIFDPSGVSIAQMPIDTVAVGSFDMKTGSFKVIDVENKAQVAL